MTPEKLSAAVQLIKSGNKQAAIPLLREIIQDNPVDENAWLWLYACVDQVEQKTFCLQKVLEINPSNQGARQALARLINPPPTPPTPRAAPRRKPRRKQDSLLAILAGTLLLLMVCSVSFIFLTQSGLVSSLAAAPFLGAPPTFTATATPSPSATTTATPSPSPSPTPTATATPTLTPTPSEVVQVTWLTGFAQSASTDQKTDSKELAVMQSVVDDFNASQSYIHLNLEVVDSFIYGANELRAAVATGHSPDILGPMLSTQANDLHNQWLDLSAFPIDPQTENPALMKALHTRAGQPALPFAVFPSALFYNTKLFKAAGLKYPPTHYGEKYEMPDGSQVEWNWDALAAVARLLTIDNKGLNATQDGFDKEHIVQYGYSWTSVRHPSTIGSYWGDGSMLTDDGRTAHIPDAWQAAWQWTYDGVWGTQPFIPTAKVENSTFLKKGNAFDSGRVAMTIQPSWSLASISIKTWDVAAIPSYNGVPGGQVDIDTLHIWMGSKHPREAYQAMSYLLNQGLPKLLTVSTPYVSLSAHKDQQQVWIDAQKSRFPWITNWDVFIAGVDYAEIPNVLSYMPNFRLAWTRGAGFYDQVFGDPGHILAAEEQNYLNYLNQIFAGGE